MSVIKPSFIALKTGFWIFLKPNSSVLKLVLFFGFLFSMMSFKSVDPKSIIDDLHDYHITIFAFKYKEDEQVLRLTCKVFIDDFEEMLKLNQVPRFNIDDEKERDKIDKHFENYFKKHFEMLIDGNKPKAKLLGHEIKDDLFKFYLEYPKIDTIKSVKFKNDFMMEMYDNQTNILFLKYKGQTGNLRFFNNITTDQLTF